MIYKELFIVTKICKQAHLSLYNMKRLDTGIFTGETNDAENVNWARPRETNNLKLHLR